VSVILGHIDYSHFIVLITNKERKENTMRITNMAENYGNTKQTLEEHKTAHRQRHYNYVPFIVSRRHRTDIYLLPCVIFYYSFYLFDKIQTHHRWLQKGSRRKRDLAVEKGERERERERERKGA